MTPKWLLCPGDVVDVLRTMPDASFDACVSDVPYGLGTREPTVPEIIAYLNGADLDMGGDFMGKKWNVPPLAFWRELRRVLKPGAPIMIFAGTRTVDLIALGIRAAGFQVGDAFGHTFDPLVAFAEFVETLDEHQRRAFERAFVSSPLMAWIHAQGFPKSLDITKAIDRMREDRGSILKVTAFVREATVIAGVSTAEIDAHFGTNGMAGHWTSSKSQPAVPTLEQWAKLKAFLFLDGSMDAEVERLNGRKGTPGEAFADRRVVGERDDAPDFVRSRPSGAPEGTVRRTIQITEAAQESSARWQGYGTAVKPAWEPIILATVPLDGTYAKNVLKHGVGALNIDGARIGTTKSVPSSLPSGHGSGHAWTKAPPSPGGDGQNPNVGRFPSNLLLSHTPDCRPAGTRKIRTGMATSRGGAMFGDAPRDKAREADVVLGYGDADGLEEIDAWDCSPSCPARILDEQSGDRPGMSGGGVHRPGYDGGIFGAIDCDATARADSGGASRFFFCSKPDRAERDFGCEHLPGRKGAEAVDREEGSAGTKSPRAGAGRIADKVKNFHPTVKGLRLLKHLATLSLPPPRAEGNPRRLIVPFSGSGSEMVAALRAGWDEVVGIQREADADERGYLEIARARLERWSQVPMDMDEDEAIAGAKAAAVDETQASLFGATGT